MLDTRYIPSKYFQEGIFDKDSGCPLAAGIVTFYRDDARTELKPVYQISGSPPNYTYTALPNPLTLSSIGTIQDGSGNDIIPYFFPYDASGNIDLYYITVESSGSVPQFTREGIPNISEQDDVAEDIRNFVPNGQFLLHHDIPADVDGGITEGEITSDVTTIAEGGWTFERTSGSTAQDFVLFERIGSFVETPNKSPRYSLRIKNTTPGGSDIFKELRLTFRDVNKFSSDTNQYTFSFEGKSNTGSASDIEVKLIKFYGTGGSATESTTLQAIALGTDYATYDVPFTFGSNDGKTIGSDDDDYVQLSISFPVSNVFDDSFDNFILTEGDIQIADFPDTTDAQFIRDSLAGWPPVPDYEGQNLYLPVRLGLNGFEYDTDSIGEYVLKSDDNLGIGELWARGAKYRVEAYSSDRIPYRRLYEKWSSESDIGLSIYGTGDDEMRFLQELSIDQQFTTLDKVLNSADAWQSFTAGNNDELVEIIIDSDGLATQPSRVRIYAGVGTGGALLSTNENVTMVSGFVNSIKLNTPFTQVSGNSYTIRIDNPVNFGWGGNSTGGYAGGSYNGTAEDARFKTLTNSPTADYRLKSNTSGTVTAAADGSVPTGFTFNPVQPDPYIIEIIAVAASGMTAGAYFTYHTTDNRKYIVWYEIGSSGSKPTESANVYRKVTLSGTETDIQVATATAIAINSYSFKVPDWRGYFIRVSDHGAGIDPDSSSRTDRGDERTGDVVGTVQQDEFESHNHGPTVTGAPLVLGSGASYALATVNAGGNETRSKNIYANIAIRY